MKNEEKLSAIYISNSLFYILQISSSGQYSYSFKKIKN